MEWTHLWISKETSSHLYGLRQLKRSRVAPKELILFCCICIRSLLEYARQFSTCTTSLPGRRFGTSTKVHSLDYLPLEKKSSWNPSSRSLQIRNTNCIHFCQKWTYLLTALGTKDYINDQDVGLNVARF